MNRREALAALVALPEVARIATTTVKPNDAIVVECDARLSCEAVERLRELVKAVWPGHPVLVCTTGVRIKVLER